MRKSKVVEERASGRQGPTLFQASPDHIAPLCVQVFGFIEFVKILEMVCLLACLIVCFSMVAKGENCNWSSV